MSQEIKDTIKNKIDKIESLNQNEVDLLLNKVFTLENESQSQSRISPP